MTKHKNRFKNGSIPWNKGMKMSDKHKEKLSKIHKKNPNRYWLGKKRPDLDLSNRVSPRGKNHWNWNGGINPISDTIRKSKEYKVWRELIFERDDWTCSKCLNRDGDINCHHILNFSSNEDLRFNIDNGITLCKKCHREFHIKYGFKNNTKEQLDEFLTDSVDNKWACEASSSRA